VSDSMVRVCVVHQIEWGWFIGYRVCVVHQLVGVCGSSARVCVVHRLECVWFICFGDSLVGDFVTHFLAIWRLIGLQFGGSLVDDFVTHWLAIL
jgi:hypothetical protein